jgi:drug/metabolite transporter (DMT)-like permease
VLLKIWSAIGVAGLGWGTSGVATRAALSAGVPEFAMVTVRTAIAALLVGGYLIARRRHVGSDATAWRAGAVLGVWNLAVPFLAVTFALRHASAGFVGLLVAMIPLATAALAHALLPDEPMDLAKAVGLLTALGGVAFLLLSGDSGLAIGGRPVLAFALTFVAVMSVSWASIYAKQRVDRYDAVELTGTQLVVAAGLMIVITGPVEGLPEAFSAWAWALLLYLAIAGSVIPFLAFFWVLRHVSATKASLIGYLVPLVALVSGITLLDEQLQFGLVVGGLLILAGVFLTDRAERVAAAVPVEG